MCTSWHTDSDLSPVLISGSLLRHCTPLPWEGRGWASPHLFLNASI